MAQKDFVVSADGHLLEPTDLFVNRLPKHLRDRAVWEEDFEIEPFVEGGATIFRRLHTPGYEGWTISRYRQTGGRMPEGDPEHILEDMDLDGVDVQVMHPNLSLFGLDLHVSTALFSVVMFEAWRSFPFAFLFLTARIQAIPDSLEEAALVDGATPTQRFRHIVLPQLLPTIAVLTVLRFIWTFNDFDAIYLLTGGGSGTQVVAVRVYDFLISRGNIGTAAAQALVLAVILAVLVIVYLKLFGRSEEVA